MLELTNTERRQAIGSERQPTSCASRSCEKEEVVRWLPGNRGYKSRTESLPAEHDGKSPQILANEGGNENT